MLKFIDRLTSKVIGGGKISFDEACRLLRIDDQKDILFLLSFANSIRNEFVGHDIDLCAIINAKSGRCSEDCIFCSQSAHYSTDIDKYQLIKKQKMLKRAEDVALAGVNRFSIVVSGRNVKDADEWDLICTAIKEMSLLNGLKICASLGLLTKKSAKDLVKAGLKRYHHNLETSKSFFPYVCTTHSYEQRLETVKIAKESGMQVCCGGIIGLGESMEQRVELAFAIKELEIDSIPLNFLNPIPGTPLEKNHPVSPMDILKTIAVFRFINPKTDIRICGGRQVNLRNTQALMYMAGASGVMVGNYLTTSNWDIEKDLQLIEDLMLIQKV